MRKLLTTILMLTAIIATSQEKELSKMQEFASATGVIQQKQYFEGPTIKSAYGVLKSEVLSFHVASDTNYYLRLTKPKTSAATSSTASIAYEDLIEVIKAFDILKKQAQEDSAKMKNEQIEKYFITDDYFQLGYYTSKGKLNWFISLERYGRSTFHAKTSDDIGEVLNFGKNKIETLSQ